jgi:hypothetical protein
MAQTTTRTNPPPNVRSGCCLGCFASIILIALSAGAFYCGGWEVAWGATRSSRQAFFLSNSELLVRVNAGYYGIMQTDRFFDSPVLSWALFGLAVLFIGAAPGALVVKNARPRRSDR